MIDHSEVSARKKSRSPGSEVPVVDLAHLEQMTLGDRRLERQVLELFARQAEMLVARMASSEPAALASLAHTLCGSARAIGARRVAAAAEALERTVVERSAVESKLAELVAAANEARCAIIGAGPPATLRPDRSTRLSLKKK